MKNQKLYYCGKRFNGDKLAQLFVDDTGKSYWFTGIKRVWIGYAYESANKSGTSMSTRPKECGGEEHEKADHWRSEDRAAIAQNKIKLMRKKADGLRDKVVDEIRLLRKFVLPLSGGERRYFLDWLLDEIEREEREAMNKRFNDRIKRIMRKKRSK